MERIVQSLSKKIAGYVSTDEEQRDVLEYGVHQTILIILNVLTVVVFGLVWNDLLFISILFVCFVTVRSYAGGYHADTELRCYLLSIVEINLLLLFKYYLEIPSEIYIVIAGVAVLIIFFLAPVANFTKPLDSCEVTVYRKRTRRMLLAQSALMILFIVLDFENGYSSIAYSFVLVCILLVSGKIKYSLYPGKE